MVQQEQQNRLMKRAGQASLTVATTLIAIKVLTFFITGSVAILSSLFDSVQDMMTSGVNMVAIRHAIEPADDEHRFGHGKAQALGSLVQAFIIAGASLFLLFESIEHFCHPRPLSHIGAGIFTMVVALILTIILVKFQNYVIHQTKSLSIRADQAHYVGDILMNIGVIISMVVSQLTGWMQLDALFGIGVSVYLFIVTYQIVREAFTMLMDTEVSPGTREKIRELVVSFSDVRDICDLRTRQSGDKVFIQFCLILVGTLPLQKVHDLTDEIEEKIKHHFPEAEIIIHPEPERTQK